jgi:hypothetical protein
MDWATSFCIVGCFTCLAIIANNIMNFKRFKIFEFTAAFERLEKDVKKLKEKP